jgi:hypothetical protein
MTVFQCFLKTDRRFFCLIITPRVYFCYDHDRFITLTYFIIFVERLCIKQN